MAPLSSKRYFFFALGAVLVSPLVEAEERIPTAVLDAHRVEVDAASKVSRAEGNVVIRQASGTLTGDSAVYNWESSSGVVRNATGNSPPYRFTAEELRILSEGVYETEDVELTSCDETPPHFVIRGSHAKVRTGQRANMTGARLVLDETPIWWLPFYTRSLRPRKYKLRVEPGSNSRDGLVTRTTLRYPFTANTQTKFLWDFRERTGNGAGLEHKYFRPDIKGAFSSYYINDINPDPLPAQKKYNVLWHHYQRFTPRLTANARFELKNPQEFGNEFNSLGSQTLVENPIRGVFSEAGFNYQFSKSAIRVEADRRDRFDQTVSSHTFISKLTLPRITINTVPLQFKGVPFYTNFSANYLNETVSRTTPQQTLRYQRSGGGGMRLQKDLRIQNKWTLTPTAGYDQTWQDRDFSSATSEKDIYIGRPSGTLTLRRRLSRYADATATYTERFRFRQNATRRDTGANDYGVEAEIVNGSLTGWLGQGSRLTLASGYDLRRAPRNFPAQYQHSSARWIPPSLDMQWAAHPSLNVFFRETYGLLDPQTREVRRTPLNTAGEIQVGNPAALTSFSQGFTYTKPQGGQTSDLILTNKLKFYLTSKWYLDFFLSYRAIADRQLDYHKAKPIERTVRVVRDLHCWIFRMEFSKRPGRTDASFYIDLKTNGPSEKNLFQGAGSPGDPVRDSGTNPFVVFPPAAPHPSTFSQP